jgi:hypothetical protein
MYNLVIHTGIAKRPSRLVIHETIAFGFLVKKRAAENGRTIYKNRFSNIVTRGFLYE